MSGGGGGFADLTPYGRRGRRTILGGLICRLWSAVGSRRS